MFEKNNNMKKIYVNSILIALTIFKEKMFNINKIS